MLIQQLRILQSKILLIIISVVFLIFIVAIVYAVPNIPNQLTQGTPESRSIDTTEKTVSAYAGNITQLTISSTLVTKRWQGYYGNITGIITLDDANNFTLFDWSLGTIEGEVYAANATVSDWSTIRCINLSADYPGYNCTGQNEECLNITEIENAYGANANDVDGVDETFNETLGSITVGTITLNNCPMVNLYVNDSSQSTYYWNETMLTINNSETIIYAGIVNDDQWGFNNVTWDFQMIVGDNGDDNIATTYNFYVELS
jgi:hypothetical protein